MPRLPLAVFVLALVVSSSSAQEPAPEGAGSAVIEDLVVIARPVGPPIWRVRRGEATLIVVGAVSPIHHQQAWNKRRVERALADADRVLLPPDAEVGPLQAARFLAGDLWRVRLGRGPRLEQRLPEPLRTRFVGYRSGARLKPARYEDWKPAVSGFLLLSDVRQFGGLSEAKPGSTIRRMAKAARVKTEPLAQYRLQPLLAAAGSLSEADHLACLDDVLNQLDRETSRPRAIGDAWAVGDLATLRGEMRTSALERCLRRMPKGRAVLDAQIAAASRSLERALDRPGKTLAVIDLAYVLPLEGVLDRLRARGAVVDFPPE